MTLEQKIKKATFEVALKRSLHLAKKKPQRAARGAQSGGNGFEYDENHLFRRTGSKNSRNTDFAHRIG